MQRHHDADDTELDRMSERMTHQPLRNPLSIVLSLHCYQDFMKSPIAAFHHERRTRGMHQYTMGNTPEDDFGQLAAPARSDCDKIGLDGFSGIENDLTRITDFIDLCHFTAGRKHAGGTIKNLASRFRQCTPQFVISLEVCRLGNRRILKKAHTHPVNKSDLSWAKHMQDLLHGSKRFL